MVDIPIHVQYFMGDVIDRVAIQFKKEKSIQLHQFLQFPVYKKASSLTNATLKQISIPDQFSYHTFKNPPKTAKLLMQIVKSQGFADFISAIVDKKVKLKQANWRIYTHKDYTVRHDKNKEPPGFDVLLEITPKWHNNACGHHSFVKNGKELIRIPPQANTLSIINRPASVQKFVKYVNHHSNKDKRVVLEARFA